MNRFLKNIIVSFLCLMVVLCVFIITTPYLYRVIPNDFVRTKIIIDKLSDSTFYPDVIFLGDSRAMSGINCNLINSTLGIKSVNFATASQRLNESALFYSQVPKSVRCVVQCAYAQSFGRNCTELSEQSASAFQMYGYRLDSITPTLLPQNMCNCFAIPKMVGYYRSRSFLKDGLSNYVRARLDDDAPSDSIASILYPYMYPSNRSANTYNRDISLGNAGENPFTHFSVDQNALGIIERSNTYFRSRGVNYMVLIVPENPDLINSTSKERARAVAVLTDSLVKKGVQIVDLSNILSPDEFYDSVHPNRKGADKIAEALILITKK